MKTRMMGNFNEILKKINSIVKIFVCNKRNVKGFYSVSQKLCPMFMANVEELLIQLSWFPHCSIGQANLKSLRPCLSKSRKWLLVYGREKVE